MIHDYEFIIGVMSDSNPVVEILKLRNGEITREEVVRRFMQGTSMEQLSLHSQDLCDKLVCKKVTCVADGTELAVDDFKT